MQDGVLDTPMLAHPPLALITGVGHGVISPPRGFHPPRCVVARRVASHPVTKRRKSSDRMRRHNPTEHAGDAMRWWQRMTSSPPDGAVLPVPDPSILTTDQLLREIARLEKLLETQILNFKELTGSNIDGLRSSMHERFLSFEAHLQRIERQRVEQKSDTKAAVDAALIAQKEAVQEQTIASGLSIAKSEAATAKQLEQLSATFAAAIASVTVTINDLKDRVMRIEAVRQGITENRTTQRSDSSIMIAAGGLLISVASIATAVVAVATR